MDIENFVRLREYLYHLTDESNLENILSERVLKSTATLARIINLPNRNSFLKTRRVGHKVITNGELTFTIRDQDPLFEKIVMKNLEDGMLFGDFVFLLNSKVFFWAKESDLQTHYDRYAKQNERPIVLRFKTAELFEMNKQKPKFCRLNSGAPRCSSYYDEGAPPRGKSTFLYAEHYPNMPSSVREVTFSNECILPDEIDIAYHISKPFKPVKA